MVNSLDVPTSQCYNCGATLDSATGEDGATPEPGMISFCLYCGAIHQFTESLGLREPTPEEYLELNADPTFRRLRERIERAVAKFNDLLESDGDRDVG